MRPWPGSWGGHLGRAGLLLALAGLWALPVHAQSRIEGSVFLRDSVPVSGVALELHRVTEESGALVDSTESGVEGRFLFDLESSAAPGPVYLVGARYGGVLYWGAPLHGAGLDTIRDYRVFVFDTVLVRSPVKDLAIPFRHLVLTPAVGGMQVEEIIDVKGRAGHTLVPAADSSVVWSATLAVGAHAVIPIQGGVPPEDVIPSEGTVGYSGPLAPTGIRIVLQYVVPGGQFQLPVEEATDRLELLIAGRPGMELEVSGLEEARTDEDMGGAVRRFSGAGLEAGHVVGAQVGWRQPGRRSAWLWLVASGALAALAFLSARWSSRQG